MNGETDLVKLLQSMNPKLNAGEYVFCLVDSKERAASLDPLGFFQEDEGMTVILPKEKADDQNLSYDLAFAWITLTVHSSLEAVGLTAAVSRALSEANISCNMVAAFHHDHIFVPLKSAKRAMKILNEISSRNNRLPA